MKYFNKFLFTLLLFPLFSLAQTNYKPGYVVTLKGDTLRGFIDYREWDSNPDLINFKPAINEKNRKLTPDDITFFNVNNLDSYVKYAGPVTMDATDPNHVGSGRDTSSKMAAIFLKVLQKGDRVTLYSYTDDIKTRFYIKEYADQNPVELIYRTYYDNSASNPNNGSSIDENTYLKQLLALGQKYNVLNDSFQWDIDHSFYNKGSILKMTSLINGISKTDFQKYYNDKTKLNLFVGVALNSTNSKPQGAYLAAGGISHTSNLPAASVGIDFFANPNTGNLIFRVELTVGENQYKSAYITKISPYIPLNYSYTQLSVAPTPQIIYNIYNADNFKIYAGLGMALTFYSYSKASFGSQDGKTPVSQITESDPYNFNPFSTPILFEAGVKIGKNWGIGAEYLTASPVSHGDYFQINFSTLRVGINYFLK
jgi:hypothetical protein